MEQKQQQKIEVFNIDNIVSGMIVSQDIKDKKGSLLVGANTELSDRLIDKLKQIGITSIPIYVTQQKSNVEINNININEIFRQQLLNRVNSSAVKYFKNDTFKQRVIDIITDITKDDILMSLLTEIKTIGHNVFLHSINVFTLSMIIGIKNSFPVDRLMVLAQAALLHDIGKKFLPQEILDDAKNMTEEQRNIFEQHALFGFEYIESLKKLPYEVARIISQHHERLDGSGYPSKLTGDNVHKLAQIISITDSFDSIIDGRDLRNKFIVSEAVEFLHGSGGIYFNYNLVTNLLEEITVYNINDWVVLNNDDIGIVSKLNKSSKLRPVVTIFFDKFKQKYNFPKQIDLTQKNNISYYIKNILE